MTHAVSGGRYGHGQEVGTFKVGRGQTVGIPGGDKGGAGHPATDGHEGAGEQEQARPAYKYKTVALKPVVHDIKEATLRLATTHRYRHMFSSLAAVNKSSQKMSFRELLLFMYS